MTNRFPFMCLLALAASGHGLQTVALDGYVSDIDYWTLSDVKVSLARGGLSTTSSKDGTWKIVGEVDLAVRPGATRVRPAGSRNLSVENGHLVISLAGADVSGRSVVGSSIPSAEQRGFASRAMADSGVVDTLLYWWKNTVVARATITSWNLKNLQQRIDTAGLWILPVPPGPSSKVPANRVAEAQYKAATALGKMVRIPATNRSFWMGLPDSQQIYDAASLPKHVVSLSYDYWMDAKETSLDEYCEVLNWAIDHNYAELQITDSSTGRRFVRSVGDNPQYLNIVVPVGGQNSTFSIDWSQKNGLYNVTGQNLPVRDASWYAAALYANLRSLRTGLEPVYDLSTWEADWTKNGFRLPTEAEWEFAAHAGTSTRFTWGDTWTQTGADFCCNTGESLYPVGTRAPNLFGLYDMIGNMDETTNDWFAPFTSQGLTDPVGPDTGSTKVYKSPGSDAWDASPAFRNGSPKKASGGFRLVLPVH